MNVVLKDLKRMKQSNGFTLVELIAVVAIISMIAVYITIEINRSSDDAKIGIATAFLTSNVPSAISSYRARNLASCRNIADTFTPSESGATAITQGQNAVTANLVRRGLSAITPWNDEWVAGYDDTNREIIFAFPTTGTNASDVTDALNTNLQNRPQIVSASLTATGSNVPTFVTQPDGTVYIVYSCS